jgi:hypothetical protein
MLTDGQKDRHYEANSNRQDLHNDDSCSGFLTKHLYISLISSEWSVSSYKFKPNVSETNVFPSPALLLNT